MVTPRTLLVRFRALLKQPNEDPHALDGTLFIPTRACQIIVHGDELIRRQAADGGTGDRDAVVCSQCKTDGIPCVRSRPKAKFKAGSSRKYATVFPKDQPWMSTQRKIGIVACPALVNSD